MKIVIKYESDTVLPPEIDEMIEQMKKRIQDNRLEPDKIEIYISNFRGSLIRWFAKNQK